MNPDYSQMVSRFHLTLQTQNTDQTDVSAYQPEEAVDAANQIMNEEDVEEGEVATIEGGEDEAQFYGRLYEEMKQGKVPQ